MDKTNLLYRIVFLLGLVLLVSSCEDDTKEENLTPSTVYFVNSGEQSLIMYDKGESTSYTYSLTVYRSGALGGKASVGIQVMTAGELSEYNASHGTRYELLDASVYTIEKNELSFSDDQKDVKQSSQVVFDPAKLSVSDQNKVLPVKISSSTLPVNAEKSVCLIRPQTFLPVFRFESPEMKAISYEKGKSTVIGLNLVSVLDIDKNDWDVDLELELDPDYLAAYNQQEGTNYIFPEEDMFNLEMKKTLKAGESSVSFSLNIFQRYLETNYMLPVRLKQSSKFGVDQTAHYVVLLNVVSAYLPKDNWAIVDFNTQELSGEGANGRPGLVIDGKDDTYWHSQWQGSKTPLPHYLVIDMKESYTLTGIDLVKRLGYNHAKGGEFWLSEDNSSWTKIGDFELAEGVEGNQSFAVRETKGRYLKVNITQSRNWDGATSLAEVSPRGY